MHGTLPGRKRTLNNWKLLDLFAPSPSRPPSRTKWFSVILRSFISYSPCSRACTCPCFVSQRVICVYEIASEDLVHSVQSLTLGDVTRWFLPLPESLQDVQRLNALIATCCHPQGSAPCRCHAHWPEPGAQISFLFLMGDLAIHPAPLKGCSKGRACFPLPV